MDYGQVEQYLNTFVNYEVLPQFGFVATDYDLAHVEELLRRLGLPQLGPCTVHIAGSKGKGSVAAMVAEALSTCGLRTGLYTSPHLLHIGERIKVDRACISPEEMESAIGAMRPHLNALMQEPRWRKLTYFELLTVMTFLYFRGRCVDAQVLEVGLGGRLDATNVVRPDVCVITPLSLEHTAVLGNTVEKIAREKAGIIKSGATVVSAPQPGEAMRVIEEVCRSRGAALIRVGSDVTFEVLRQSLDGQTVGVRGSFGRRVVRVPLAGTYEAENVATAVAAVEALRARGIVLDPECIVRGLAQVDWPGRFQVLARRPLLILDGAHNPASMGRLAESIRNVVGGGEVVFVLGFSADKDMHGSVAALSELGGRIVLTRSPQPRAALPLEVAMRLVDLGARVTCEPDVERALWLARDMTKTEGTVCVAGSLYLVGEVLRLWQAQPSLPERWPRGPQDYSSVPRQDA